MKESIKPLRFREPVKYTEYWIAINQIESVFNENNLTMCDFPYEFDGVLKDQTSYYLTNYDTIFQNVLNVGKDITDALTIESFSS